MGKKSNIGEVGAESIRLNNMKIEDLPLGQGNQAKDSFAEFLKTDKQTKIENIRAKYPKHSVDYINGIIRECEGNIKKIKNFKADLRKQVSEYEVLIRNCLTREQELANYSRDNPEHKEKIKELNRKYPPYDMDALNQQVTQFRESIDRCDEVIEKDYNSISEAKEILALIKQRDRDILNVS